MGAWTEQRVRDRLMDYFIGTDPVDIVLQRPTWVDTTAGGRVKVGVDSIAQQRFHIYPFKRRLTQEYTFNPQNFGEEKVEKILYILIFNRGSDIQVDDYFNPATDLMSGPATNRLLDGIYDVSFISARLWDRGQCGLMYRG